MFLLKNKFGMSSIEAIISIGLVALLVGGVSYSSISSSHKRTLHDTQLIQLRERVLSYLNHPISWSDAVNNKNNKFEWCSNNISACKSSAVLPLSLSSPSKQQVIGSIQDPIGFNRDLSVCTKQNTQECLYQVKAGWVPLCSSKSICSQVEVNVSFYVKSNHRPKFDLKIKKNKMVGSLDLSLTYKQTYDNSTKIQPKMKLVVIVDNSESMSNNLEALKKSFKKIIKGFKDLNVDILFYTTSANLGYVQHFFKGNVIFGSAFIDGETNNANLVKITQQPGLTIKNKEMLNELVVRAYPEQLSLTSSQSEGLVHFHLNRDRALQLGLTLNTSELEDVLNKKIDSVFDNLIAGYGHSDEAGLCTLNRILIDQGPNKQLNLDKDQPFFLVMSDENDHSFSQYGTSNRWLNTSCVYRSRHRKSSTNKLISCNIADTSCIYKLYVVKAKHTIDGPVKSMSGEVVLEKNGEHFVHQIHGEMYKYLGGTSFVYGDATYPKYKNTCSAQLIDFIFKDFKKFATNDLDKYSITDLVSCEVRAYNLNNKVMQKYVGLGFYPDVPPNREKIPSQIFNAKNCKVDLTGFKHKLGSYNSPEDWLLKSPESPYSVGGAMRDCKISVELAGRYKMASTPIDKVYDSIPENVWSAYEPEVEHTRTSHTTKGMPYEDYAVDATLKNITKYLKGTPFYMSSITHLNASLCAKDNTGSKGSAYQRIVANSNSPTENYDICTTDYDEILKNMLNQVKSVSENTIVFTQLADGKSLKSVYIERGGQSVPVSSGDYQRRGNSIRFNPGILINGDEVSLVVAK